MGDPEDAGAKKAAADLASEVAALLKQRTPDATVAYSAVVAILASLIGASAMQHDDEAERFDYVIQQLRKAVRLYIANRMH